jgi:hypothetical protein
MTRAWQVVMMLDRRGWPSRRGKWSSVRMTVRGAAVSA